VSLACGGVAGGLRQSGGSLFWMQVAGGGITSDEVDHTAQSIAAWARDL
jgi:hypothetical protein